AWSFASGPQTPDESGNGRTLTTAGTPVADTSGPPDVLTNSEALSFSVAATVTAVDTYRTTSGLYTDNFNRADTTTPLSGGYGLNEVNTDWDAPAWAISSNKAASTGSSGSDYATFRNVLGLPNHFVEVDYNVTGGGT